MSKAALVLAAAVVLTPQLADAKSWRAAFVSAAERVNVGPVVTGDTLSVSGTLKSIAEENVRNIIAFRAEATSMRANIAWQFGAPGEPMRISGVNVDLLNAAGNIVASDEFVDLASGVGVAQLNFVGLVPGQTYKLVFTGLKQGVGNYMISVYFPPAP